MYILKNIGVVNTAYSHHDHEEQQVFSKDCHLNVHLIVYSQFHEHTLVLHSQNIC